MLCKKIIQFIDHKNKIKLCKEMVIAIFNKAAHEVKMKERAASILIIQKAIRGMFLRSSHATKYTVFNHNLMKFKYQNSFEILKKGYQRFKIINRFRKLKKSIITIQRHFRFKWTRQYFLTLKSSTIILQRFFKSYLIKKREINKMHQLVDLDFQQPEFTQKMINKALYNFTDYNSYDKNRIKIKKYMKERAYLLQETDNLIKTKNNYLKNLVPTEFETFSCNEESRFNSRYKNISEEILFKVLF